MQILSFGLPILLKTSQDESNKYWINTLWRKVLISLHFPLFKERQRRWAVILWRRPNWIIVRSMIIGKTKLVSDLSIVQCWSRMNMFYHVQTFSTALISDLKLNFGACMWYSIAVTIHYKVCLPPLSPNRFLRGGSRFGQGVSYMIHTADIPQHSFPYIRQNPDS